ncbi:MAG: HAMP domain-containing histidine kinase [Acidobacteria bacterium]|nr:HAMP domain-containing histidine kinase [Acidobacteriota bacterium]
MRSCRRARSHGRRGSCCRKDLAGAARVYSRLAADVNTAVRAGALTRLARVRRKMQDPEAALRAYDGLSGVSDVRVAGLPAGLVARAGKASVLEETHRASDLRHEAAALDGDLRGGRWQIVKSEYEFYRSQAKTWLGADSSAVAADDPEAVARAEALGRIWQEKPWENQPASGGVSRRVIRAGDRSVLVLWNVTSAGFIAAVAGPSYLATLCGKAITSRELGCTLVDAEGHILTGPPPPARLAVTRTAATMKLPWSLQVFPAAGADIPAASSRRGLLLWVLAVLAAVWLTGAYFIVRSISRELRVARLQSDFVAAVSHEFRSPLSSLCQISEMLALDRFDSDDVRHKSYGVLARESERLHRLVEGLLDFGRFEAGAASYHFESLDIGSFLESLVADFQERAAATGYNIELSRTDAGIYVRADREALSRAVWNLLDNAIKYSPECRTVWVEAGRDHNRVTIAIRDRGLGIPVQEQREIFEKFVRGADSKTLRIKGTGIGLAMVRHIMQAHGGEILVASEPGEGSRFTMILNTTTGGVS